MFKKCLMMGIVCCGAFLLSGCGVRAYRKTALRPVSKTQAHWQREQDDIQVRVHACTDGEVKELFSDRSFDERSHIGMCAVTVDNKTQATLELDRAHVGLPLLSDQQMYKRLAYSSDGGYGVVMGMGIMFGVFAVLGAPAGAVCCCLGWAGIAVPWLTCVAASSVAIVSAHRGHTSIKQFNRELLADLVAKSLTTLVIKPATDGTRVFCAQPLSKQFDIAIKRCDTNQYVRFAVQLP